MTYFANSCPIPEDRVSEFIEDLRTWNISADQIHDIFDIVGIYDCDDPAIIEVENERELMSHIRQHIKLADSNNETVEELYEALIAEHREQFGYESEFFPKALEYYREHRDLFA